MKTNKLRIEYILLFAATVTFCATQCFKTLSQRKFARFNASAGVLLSDCMGGYE